MNRLKVILNDHVLKCRLTIGTWRVGWGGGGGGGWSYIQVMRTCSVQEISGVANIFSSSFMRCPIHINLGCYGTPLGHLGIPVIKKVFNNWDAQVPQGCSVTPYF